MAPLLWRRFLMDNDTLVALLDNLVTSGIDVAPGARRQPLRVVRVRHFFLVGDGPLQQRVVIGAGPSFHRHVLRGLFSHSYLLKQTPEHKVRGFFRRQQAALDCLIDSGDGFVVFVAGAGAVSTERLERSMLQFVFYGDYISEVVRDRGRFGLFFVVGRAVLHGFPPDRTNCDGKRLREHFSTNVHYNWQRCQGYGNVLRSLYIVAYTAPKQARRGAMPDYLRVQD